MAVFGYIRVSTTAQAEEGQSLTTQERQVRSYASMHGHEVDHIFIERGISGSTYLAERPQGAALLEVVKAGDMIVTPKLDRMFRSAVDALRMMELLRDQEVGVHMIDLGGDVTGNGIAKLVFTILAAVAEAERDRIRERIADVKRDQKQRGRYLGGSVPFGYRIGDDGALLPDDDQQAALSEARALRAGGASMREIARHLGAMGHKISHVSVGRALNADL
ncbi:Resolvase [Hyphomicrobiales bacterium]|jgi:DNA invertase Pin-like site-specific DNA recombinase|nr:Resolvase [Hyphomicrobiales bacterium]CAH1696911.1 Resolvase [Hyphomicrobiales bacterium]